MIKFAPLYATVLFAQIALGMLTPLTPIILLAHGVATFPIGIVAAAYYAGMLTGAWFIPLILMRIGHLRALAIFCVIAADATLLAATTTKILPWIGIRFVTGICSIGVFTVVESWLNASARRTMRGRIFGVYLLSSWTGSVAGAGLLAAFKSAELLIGLATATFITTLLPTTILTRIGPALPDRGRIPLATLLRLSPIGAITCLIAGLSSGMFFSMFPVFLETQGIRQDGISLAVSLCLLAGMAMQFPVGMLADRIGRLIIVRTVLVLAMAACAGLSFGHTLAWFASFGTLYGAAAGVLYGLGAGLTADRANQEQLVGVSSGVLSLWALGACTGPLIGAATLHLDPHVMFVTLLGLFAGVWGLVKVGKQGQGALPPGPPPGT